MTYKLQENYSWPQMVTVVDISHFITGCSLENLRSQAQQVLRNELLLIHRTQTYQCFTFITGRTQTGLLIPCKLRF